MIKIVVMNLIKGYQDLFVIFSKIVFLLLELFLGSLMDRLYLPQLSFNKKAVMEAEIFRKGGINECKNKSIITTR